MKSFTHRNQPLSELEKVKTVEPAPVPAPYSRPTVSEAGCVFLRTQALGTGTKDVISGSTLL